MVTKKHKGSLESMLDEKHNHLEERYHALGKTDSGRLLHITFTLRVGGRLSEFVGQNISEDGEYDNVSEYIRSLIRQDKTRKEEVLFLRLKAELQQAFNAPESEYISLSAQEVISHNAKII